MLPEDSRVVKLDDEGDGVFSFEKARILYSDGSTFFEGWIEDKGNENSGPIVFEQNRRRFGLDEDIANECRRYQQIIPFTEDDVVIRQAAPEDRDAILDLRFHNYFDGHYNKVSAYQALKQQFDADHVTFVVQVGNLPVGHAYVVLHRARGTAYLDDLFVHQSYRGNGIGTKLLSAAEQRAQTEGCPCVELQCIGEEDFV